MSRQNDMPKVAYEDFFALWKGADAGLRLFCEYTVPSHVVFGHGGAIIGAMAFGAIVAKIIRR